MRFVGRLDRVRIAAPCKAEWMQMHGDERVRFCDQCKLHVYNLSAMTQREAARLVASTEDRLCVRFYRRTDGTILTRNCPVGLSAIKRRVTNFAGFIFAAVTTLLLGISVTTSTRRDEVTARSAMTKAEETAAEYPYTECMGTCSEMIRDTPFVPGTLLGTVVFLFGYPLLKLKQRHEAKRSAALHIWQRDGGSGT